jgi:hypothetical protein
MSLAFTCIYKGAQYSFDTEALMTTFLGAQEIEGNSFELTSIDVASGQEVGSSAADASKVGATILGYAPSAQDQMVTSIVLNEDGSITVTLAAGATATNTFNVVVLNSKPY